MTILERYIGRSFLGAALLAWLMLTFVLVVGLLMKVTTLVSRGLKPEIVWRYITFGVPETFAITIPLALLVSALLVFGRLSADSEIAAMRACGVNLLLLMRAPVLAGLGLAAFCFYVQNEIIPRSNLGRREYAGSVDTSSGLALFEPGRFIRDFPGVEIHFERKQGDFLHNVTIIEFSDPARPREVRADKAEVTEVPEVAHMGGVTLTNHNIRLRFFHARVDLLHPDRPGAATFDLFTHTLTNAFKARYVGPQDKNRNLPELLDEIPKVENSLAKARVNYREAPSDMNRRLFEIYKARLRNIYFEINRRCAFSLTPVCFILLGIPLGIRSHRRESTVGIGIALGVAFSFYMCQVAAEAAVRTPFFPYYLLVWLPVALCLGISCRLIPKNQ
ncbi:MAG: LptF/LptG family permease [Kiritimatiellaeota bacterium]|nr:LptF/LptG family permease [Kiritimatiellota bacterium]